MPWSVWDYLFLDQPRPVERLMNLTDDLQKLKQLHDVGAISDEEFALAKAKLLHPTQGPLPGSNLFGPSADLPPEEELRQTNQWAFILHLSLLAGYLLPFAGLVLPIIIWQLKKGDLPGIDAHGKIVVNWIISAGIYAVVFGLLV